MEDSPSQTPTGGSTPVQTKPPTARSKPGRPGPAKRTKKGDGGSTEKNKSPRSGEEKTTREASDEKHVSYIAM